MNSNTKKLTNTKNLPNFLVQSFQAIRDEYSKGEADFSVTDFLKPIHQKRLQEQCLGDISEDASEMYYSVRGTALHNRILDKLSDKRFNERYRVEERFFDIFPEMGRISGQIDVYDTKEHILYDIKETSVWSIVYKSKMDEWSFQLNAYRMLMNCNIGFNAIGGLKVVAFLRDWQKTKAKFDKDYPQSDIQIVDIPYIPDAQIIERMENYASEYRDYNMSSHCSVKDRWQAPTKYAVMKKGRKSALKLHDVLDDAVAHSVVLEDNFNEKYWVEHRLSEPKRCTSYCNVSGKCAFYKKYQESLNE